MPKPESYYDINAVPLSAEIIVCPSCHDGTCLEFRPLAFSTWAQCRCGYGWDLPGAWLASSKAVN